MLNEYADKFDDNFPMFSVNHLEEKEIIRVVKESIAKNELYEPNYNDKADY